jgi:alpha-glucosidase
MGNHDQSRIATRIGSAQARIAAMLLLTLRGTPTMYYGDEIAMTDTLIPAAEVQDPAEKNEPGKGMGRDPERTPMQWDSSRFAGFTTATPWLRLGADHATVNVTTLSGQSESVLSLYRTLIALRNGNAALNSGRIESVAGNGGMLGYERVDDEQRFAILLNFNQSPEEAPIAAGHIVVSTHMDRAGDAVESRVSLRQFEGVVVRLAG